MSNMTLVSRISAGVSWGWRQWVGLSKSGMSPSYRAPARHRQRSRGPRRARLDRSGGCQPAVLDRWHAAAGSGGLAGGATGTRSWPLPYPALPPRLAVLPANGAAQVSQALLLLPALQNAVRGLGSVDARHVRRCRRLMALRMRR